jgi:hypothetical protein
MKLARGAIGRALDRPDPNIRFYLFHGSDEGQSRSHAQRLLAVLGATRFVVASGSVKSDPALLAAEAGAMSLFGGPRLIWIEPAGEDIFEGVQALLGAPATESPVVAIAGALKKTSGLLKLADSSPAALSYVSYIPEGQDAERMVCEVGRTLGLKIAAGVAARVAFGMLGTTRPWCARNWKSSPSTSALPPKRLESLAMRRSMPSEPTFPRVTMRGCRIWRCPGGLRILPRNSLRLQAEVVRPFPFFGHCNADC